MKAQIASKIITFISIGGCASFAVLDDPCRERGSCYFCVDVGSVPVPHTIFRLHLLLPADPSRAPGEILTASARNSTTPAYVGLSVALATQRSVPVLAADPAGRAEYRLRWRECAQLDQGAGSFRARPLHVRVRNAYTIMCVCM